MIESQTREYLAISNERKQVFREAEKKLHFTAGVYPLGDRFEGLTPELAHVWVLDVTRVPGCHYGLKNVFVPIIEDLETHGIDVGEQHVPVSPETAILVEPSTGNGWVAFSDAAETLGYQYVVIMPDGLPEARYRHPAGRRVTIIKTPAQDYAVGMPKQLKKLIKENPQRLADDEKIYVTPNHPISAAEITVKTMSELGRQLLTWVDEASPIRAVVSMGNGASLCALGEYLKENSSRSKVVATESFVFGEGYDTFAQLKNLPRYRELYGIDPGNTILMKAFSAYGTNAPIHIELPLQTRAMSGNLIDDYMLFTDSKAVETFKQLIPSGQSLENVARLPNYSNLPQSLFGKFGNSTLANIATASSYTNGKELVVAMAYDGRGNYV